MPPAIALPGDSWDATDAELFQPEPLLTQGLMLFAAGESVYAIDLFAGVGSGVRVVASIPSGSRFLSSLLPWGADFVAAAVIDEASVQMVRIRPKRRGEIVRLDGLWDTPQRICESNLEVDSMAMTLKQGTFGGPVCFVPAQDAVVVAVPPVSIGAGSTVTGGDEGPWRWQLLRPDPAHGVVAVPPLRRCYAQGKNIGIGNPLAAGPDSPRLVVCVNQTTPAGLRSRPFQVQVQRSGVGVFAPASPAADGIDLFVSGEKLFGAKAVGAGKWEVRQLGLACLPVGGRPPLRPQDVDVLYVLAAQETMVLMVQNGLTLQLEMFDRMGSAVDSVTLGAGETLSPPALCDGRVVCIWRDGNTARASAVELESGNE